MRMDAFHSWGNGTGFTYFLRSLASWWSRNPSAHCCQLQCGPLLLRELRLGHCSFAHRLHSEMITGNRYICSRVRYSLRLATVLFSFMLNSGTAVANVFRCEQRTRVHVTRNTAKNPTISRPLFDLLFPRFSPELKGDFWIQPVKYFVKREDLFCTWRGVYFLVVFVVNETITVSFKSTFILTEENSHFMRYDLG